MIKEEKIKSIWAYMEEKGLKLNEKIKIKNDIAKIYRDEYPNIKSIYLKDKTIGYCSNIEQIKQFKFKTKNEVILVNAIYENIKNDFKINKFRNNFIYTFRLLGIKSEWI